MSTMKIVCAWCSKPAVKASGGDRRSWRIGAPVYCGRRCAGLARRKGKTKTQRVEEKRIYDAAYREKNLASIKAKKAARYQATRDPVKEAAYRKANMARHVEYCRRPEYKAYKREYDRKLRARDYGPFADCFLLLQDLNAEIASRMSKYEIYIANGRFEKYHAKRRQRRLENAQPISR